MRFSFAAAVMLTEGRNAIPGGRYLDFGKIARWGRTRFSARESEKDFDHRKPSDERKALTDSRS